MFQKSQKPKKIKFIIEKRETDSESVDHNAAVDLKQHFSLGDDSPLLKTRRLSVNTITNALAKKTIFHKRRDDSEDNSESDRERYMDESNELNELNESNELNEFNELNESNQHNVSAVEITKIESPPISSSSAVTNASVNVSNASNAGNANTNTNTNTNTNSVVLQLSPREIERLRRVEMRGKLIRTPLDLIQMEKDKFLEQFESFSELWTINTEHNDIECENIAAENFGISLENIDEKQVTDGYGKNYNFALGLMSHLTAADGHLTTDNTGLLDYVALDQNSGRKYTQEESAVLKQRANKFINLIKFYADVFTRKINIKHTVNDHDYTPFLGNPLHNRTRTWLAVSDTDNPEEYTEKQKLHCEMLARLQSCRYRKWGEQCYEQIYTASKPTHAWRPKCTIEQFVIENCNRQKDLANWRVLSKGRRNLEEIVFDLSMLEDHEFPRICKDRHKFSFRNGVYMTKVVLSTVMVDGKTAVGLDGKPCVKYTDKFYPYNSQTIQEVDSSTASANYFDLDFNVHDPKKNGTGIDDDWYDIPTPSFQKVADYQFKHRPDHVEIVRWLYIMLGRCLFGFKELDRWQVMMYVIGLAGTGKSTFTNHVLKKIFRDTDVGILDNNIEEQFGLYNLIKSGEKFVTIGVELDNTFKLKRTDFLKMVSGDDLMIAVKGSVGFTYLWPSHIVCVGNKLFGFEDSKGELARRIVPFMYDFKVKTSDTDIYLEEKLYAELPSIIQKITKAYLWAAEKYGTKNIWSVLPKYFHEMKMRISEQTNILQAFLNSNDVVCGKDEYCLERQFRETFMDYCKKRSIRAPKLNNEMYQSVLQDLAEERGFPVYFQPNANKVYPRKGGKMCKNESFVCGLDIVIRDSPHTYNVSGEDMGGLL